MRASATLKELREDGLVEFRGKIVTIRDRAKLKTLAQFNPNYLHLQRTERSESNVSHRAGDLV